ncbi:hypothetical protein [Citromicrobium bathyomarinum]|uniref:hypothetical protein n=1 Tax=Citromicrobium bathyomarinum TaxID=72174 RepID=UPI00315AD1E6
MTIEPSARAEIERRLEAIIKAELQRAGEVPERRDDGAFAKAADGFFLDLVLPDA